MLVIRAWIEGNELRARIVHTRDTGSTKTVTVAAGSAEEVMRVVERWLRSFAGTT